MNREQREQYEQVTADTPFNQIQTQTLEGSPVVFSQGLDTLFFSFLEQQGTLPFLFDGGGTRLPPEPRRGKEIFGPFRGRA